MTVQINFKGNYVNKNSENLVLFVNDAFDISNLKKYISKSEYLYISDLLNINDKKKKLSLTILIQKKKSS